jgi:hypothetical protein
LLSIWLLLVVVAVGIQQVVILVAEVEVLVGYLLGMQASHLVLLTL